MDLNNIRRNFIGISGCLTVIKNEISYKREVYIDALLNGDYSKAIEEFSSVMELRKRASVHVAQLRALRQLILTYLKETSKYTLFKSKILIGYKKIKSTIINAFYTYRMNKTLRIGYKK